MKSVLKVGKFTDAYDLKRIYQWYWLDVLQSEQSPCSLLKKRNDIPKPSGIPGMEDHS